MERDEEGSSGNPEHQGHGIGKTLERYVETEAIQYPADIIVVPSSFTAHDFYHKLGYVDDDQNRENNDTINIWMHKELKKRT